MKVIVLNRKRLGVTIIIIGLMMLLFAFEKGFDGRLKFVSLMQNNIKTFKEYDGLGKKLSYKLPSEWTTKEQNFGGEEVVYHNDFTSGDARITGFVEVWNMRQDLKTFLSKIKVISEMQSNSFTDYIIRPISINNHEGYLVTYNMQSSSNGYYKGFEYYLKDTGKFIRFSFFIREGNFKESMSGIFNTIVETFNYKS